MKREETELQSHGERYERDRNAISLNVKLITRRLVTVLPALTEDIYTDEINPSL